MTSSRFIGLLIGLFFIFNTPLQAAEIDWPLLFIKGKEAKIVVDDIKKGEEIKAVFNRQEIPIQIIDNQAIILCSIFEKGELSIRIDNKVESKTINPIPLWLSILPPLITILLALLFKEVILSLILGIFTGSFIIHFYSQGFLMGLLKSFMAAIDTYILGALSNSGHLAIILFSLLIGGTVNVISKNGGMKGVVNKVSKYANNAKSGQLATWALGIIVFFDDYANTLIVGNTMRPITDRLKISREKLAYIVDSTAAPVASIAFITTWIGAELSYISDGINKIDGLNEGVYATFINSLAYSFYPIFTLVFILILILKDKDYGPMHKAEYEARRGTSLTNTNRNNSSMHELIDNIEPKESIIPKAYNAIIPVLIIIFGTIAGLIYTGYSPEIWSNVETGFWHKLSETIGESDSYLALLWSSFAALGLSILLSVSSRLLSLVESIEATINGFKTMFSAISILVLAWALAIVIEDLNTASFITSIMSENISPFLIPAITFILASLIAFSTGSSWGTMAILYPLIIPACWKICQEYGLNYEETLSIFHNSISCVLAGAVLGDHCSPISDTTILSSLATSCNHIEHVRTQMPYALSVGAVAVLVGTLPSAYGLPVWIAYTLGFIVLYFIVNYFGKSTSIKFSNFV